MILYIYTYLKQFKAPVTIKYIEVLSSFKSFQCTLEPHCNKRVWTGRCLLYIVKHLIYRNPLEVTLCENEVTFLFCHTCTCYYWFCGNRYTEVFAIVSSVILGSIVHVSTIGAASIFIKYFFSVLPFQF